MAKYSEQVPTVTLPKLHNDKLAVVFDYLEHKSWDKDQGFNAYRVLSAIIKKANNDTDYLVKFKHFIENGSTLDLRELCEPFGNYWDSSATQFQNAVDALDTCFGKSGREADFPVRYNSLSEALSQTIGIIIDGEMLNVTWFDSSGGIIHLKNPSTGKEYEHTIHEISENLIEIDLIRHQPILI